MRNPQSVSVTDAFERALGAIRARVSVSASAPAGSARLAVAYSGGLDSTVLLHLARDYADARGIELFAFHIHHGISPNAGAWLLHCEHECSRLGIRFEARRVTLLDRERDGVEQAARISRYAALGDMCRLHGVPLLLTAHHLDDQAETVLLQLLRGAGVAGLSGMDRIGTAAELLGDDNVMIGRPLMDVSRTELEQFAAQRNIGHVEDESNAELHYARNVLRHAVMPVFDKYFPGFQERLARAARHVQAAQRMLTELAAQDLSTCSDGEYIDIASLKRLGSDRIDNVLRYWLMLHKVRMPSTAWLSEMREQLLVASHDAQIRVTHADCEIRRHRGKIHLTARISDAEPMPHPIAFRWNGETQIPFPAYRGILHFDLAQEGASADWLREQGLLLRSRSGGERLKLAVNRPTRSLKHHYQALNIPAWERQWLPVVTTDNGQLLFAAGIGMNWREAGVEAAQFIRLRWEREKSHT